MEVVGAVEFEWAEAEPPDQIESPRDEAECDDADIDEAGW